MIRDYEVKTEASRNSFCSAEFLHHTPTMYLFNTLEGMTLDEMVREFFWEAIFDNELVAWMRDTSVWPADRTVEMFYEWFVVELVADLIDLGRGRIKSR